MNWQNYPYHFEGLEKHLEKFCKKAELDKLPSNSGYAVKKHQREFNARMDV